MDASPFGLSLLVARCYQFMNVKQSAVFCIFPKIAMLKSNTLYTVSVLLIVRLVMNIPYIEYSLSWIILHI